MIQYLCDASLEFQSLLDIQAHAGLIKEELSKKKGKEQGLYEILSTYLYKFLILCLRMNTFLKDKSFFAIEKKIYNKYFVKCNLD